MMRNAPVHARAPRARRPPADPYHSAGGLAAALDAHDRALGLGRGGPVAIEARRAAVTAGPETGRITLVVETDASGRVRSITPAGARPNAAAWRRVIAQLSAALREKRLRVPPGARGLRVTVRVEAREQSVSGRAPSGGGLSLSFDVADLSGKVMRVVSARVQSQQVL